MNRPDAYALLCEYVSDISLRRHCMSVEAAMRAYARKLGHDGETWGIVGLLHDFDYERWPTPADHPLRGSEILRAKGYPEDVITCILSHADYLSDRYPRRTVMEKGLYACDEITGLITATALMRPTGIGDLTASSVKKKMKTKGFAKGVNRDDVVRGAAEFGADLDEHIQFVIDAMKTIAAELGLEKAAATEAAMTPDEFREYGHKLIDGLADYRAGIASRPVIAQTEPGQVKAALPTEPPAEPEPFDAVIADLDRVIMPGLTHWQHPRFFGYFPSNASLASVLGDLVSSGLGVIGLNWQASPALTELEEVVCDWMRRMLGLSAAWSGVIQDTASTGSLLALLCARERTTNFSLARGGLQAEPRPLTVYVSTQSHSSVEKAALLAGFGRENIRAVPHDDAFAMRPDALDEMANADLAAGRLPCAVVATTGTTASTALDPVAPVAEIAARHRLWLHVDAAMVGSAMILPECRWMWEGVERADTVLLNPHKWLGAVFDCSLYYTRDPDHLVRVMSTNPSYLRTAADGRVKNYRDWGIPLGRRFRALKLWCLLRSEGVIGLQARLRRDIDSAKWFADQVRVTPHWSVVAPVPLQTVCVVHEPPGVTGEALDAHTRAWVERVNCSGRAYLTPAILGGRWVVRVSVGAEQTTRADVEALWALMRSTVEGGAVP